MGETVSDLAKVAKQGQDTKDDSHFKVPIMAALLAQLMAAVAVVAIPLGYISLSNAQSVTSDLTARIVNATVQQTADKLIPIFASFATSIQLLSSMPGIPDFQDAHYDSLQTPNPNTTLAMLRIIQQNPLCSSVTIGFHPNLTSAPPIPYPIAPGFGVLANPCKFFGVPINATCHVRGWQDSSTGGNCYGRLINSTTGIDISPSIMLSSVAKNIPNEDYVRFYGSQEPTNPVWRVSYTYGIYTRFSFMLSVPFTHRFSNAYKYTVLAGGYLPCLETLESFFTGLLPTPDSSIYFVDDTGAMVASTVNGSVSTGPVRYNATTTPSSLVNSASQYIESNIAPFNQSALFPPETTQTISIEGTQYIVNTKKILMPLSNQPYQIVLLVPREAFYGSSDTAFRNSIITASCVAVGGLIVVSALAYFASIPLKNLATSMEKLTKFDFTVLENGQLEHKSVIAELAKVETSFLMMVKAFAAAIRKNKELLSRSGGQQASTK